MIKQAPPSSPDNRSRKVFLFFFCLFLGTKLSSYPVSASGSNRFLMPDSDLARVTAVYDGDTVKVKFEDGRQRKVRFIGVDAPEMDDARESVRFMAGVAKRVTFLKLFGRMARLSYDWQREDKYGRLLAYLTTDDGVLFNEWIVAEGFASVLRAFPFDKDLMKKFDEAERTARRAEKGLWKKGPYTLLLPSEIGGHENQIVSIRFLCSKIEERKAFVVLVSDRQEVEILISRRDKRKFRALGDFVKRPLRITGLVEKNRERFQILLFDRVQLKFE